MVQSYLIFAKKLGLFILIVFILDYSLGSLMEHYYFQIDALTPEQHTTYSVEHADADVMVFGSSRAQHHYDPESFEEFTSSFYNTGKDGQGIFYSWAILKTLLNRSKSSKIIVLDINPHEFAKNQDSYDRLSELLPYYHEHDEIKEIVNLKSRFEKYKAISNLYRYNSKILTIIKDNLLPTDDDMKNGFEPMETSDINLEMTEVDDQNVIDSLEVEAFVGFLEDAKEAGHEVYVFVSPVYRRYRNGITTSLRITEEICKELDVPFFPYHKDSVFLKSPSYFSDPTHLNQTGARVYSDDVCNKIRAKRGLTTIASD